ARCSLNNSALPPLAALPHQRLPGDPPFRRFPREKPCGIVAASDARRLSPRPPTCRGAELPPPSFRWLRRPEGKRPVRQIPGFSPPARVPFAIVGARVRPTG